MKTQKTERPVGGIYRDNSNEPQDTDKRWILEWPSPLGHTCYETLAAANAAARKNKLVPKRWANCDRE
jgi:hypothetical protein